MTVLEIMERVGSTSTHRAIAYIKDGLLELQSAIPDKLERKKYSVVADTRYYALPSNMIDLKSVWKLFDDDGNYVRIPRLLNVEILQDSDSTTSTADSGVILI